MSILGDLDSLILRDTSHPPLTNKGSELTYAEMDARIIGFYDAVQSIVSGANVTSYNAATTYDDSSDDIYKRFAGYGSRIWKAIGTFTGQTPAEGIYWTQVTLAELLPDVLKVAESAESGLVVKTAKLSLSNAQLLTINTTPVGFGLSVPAAHHVEILATSTKMTFATAAFLTNTQLQLTMGGGSPLGQIGNNILAATSTKTTSAFTPTNPSAGQTQVLSATDVFVTNTTGDPTVGGGSAVVRIMYVIVED